MFVSVGGQDRSEEVRSGVQQGSGLLRFLVYVDSIANSCQNDLHLLTISNFIAHIQVVMPA